MQICLVRHGIAVERGTPGYEDDDTRPLTLEGKQRMTQAAKGIVALAGIERIVSSPVLRARQTASILRDAASVSGVDTLAALADGDHEAVLAWLRRAQESTIALVGHEPWMSELASVALSGEPGRMWFDFKKGAAALIRFDGTPAAGKGLLVWFMPPAALRKLAKRS